MVHHPLWSTRMIFRSRWHEKNMSGWSEELILVQNNMLNQNLLSKQPGHAWKLRYLSHHHRWCTIHYGRPGWFFVHDDTKKICPGDRKRWFWCRITCWIRIYSQNNPDMLGSWDISLIIIDGAPSTMVDPDDFSFTMTRKNMSGWSEEMILVQNNMLNQNLLSKQPGHAWKLRYLSHHHRWCTIHYGRPRWFFVHDDTKKICPGDRKRWFWCRITCWIRIYSQNNPDMLGSWDISLIIIDGAPSTMVDPDDFSFTMTRKKICPGDRKRWFWCRITVADSESTLKTTRTCLEAERSLSSLLMVHHPLWSIRMLFRSRWYEKNMSGWSEEMILMQNNMLIQNLLSKQPGHAWKPRFLSHHYRWCTIHNGPPGWFFVHDDTKKICPGDRKRWFWCRKTRWFRIYSQNNPDMLGSWDISLIIIDGAPSTMVDPDDFSFTMTRKKYVRVIGRDDSGAE